jgi:hypothetical protein
MKMESFCYWLQGYFELQLADCNDSLDEGLSGQQVDCIRKHLALVFAHDIDPKAGPQAVQDALNKVHNQGPFMPPAPTEPTLYRC